MAQDKEENLTRIAYEAQAYQQQGQFMQQQLGSIQLTINELGTALLTLRNIETTKDNNVLLPLGGGAHVSARITDVQNVLVNIGADVIAEKPLQEAISILEERLKRLEATRDRIQEAVLEISKKLDQLDNEAQQLLDKKGGKQ